MMKQLFSLVKKPFLWQRIVAPFLDDTHISKMMLDFGCGPGLYTKRFSALEYHVTGVDLSKKSFQ